MNGRRRKPTLTYRQPSCAGIPVRKGGEDVKCLVADNVSTADELVEQHGTYSALIEHFTVDGEPLDGLLEGTIPRWMRFPANLASGHDKQAPVDTMST